MDFYLDAIVLARLNNQIIPCKMGMLTMKLVHTVYIKSKTKSIILCL